MCQFTLNDTEKRTAAKFFAEEDEKTVVRQKEMFGDRADSIVKADWESGLPYGGAIGGFYSYIFTPTSIGTTVIARHNGTGVEKNITDYSDW